MKRLFVFLLTNSYLCTIFSHTYIMVQESNTTVQPVGEEFEIIAKTFMGLEPVLAKELAQLGASDIQTGRRMVSFKGNKELLYRANFQLHTAIRILKPIKHFHALSADDVYEGVKDIDWSEYIALDKTFAVDSVVFSEEFRHSKFVAYKVKDAIVDQFRERTGQRPNISISNPDIRLHIHIAEDQCTLCLDSSGESLHRRGYRQESVEAPLNEVLAAGMILMTGWHGECDFIDPMCGSGTLLIEAALIAHNMAPGLFRKEFAFEKWPDFDADLFDKIYNDDSQEREFNHHIYGYDVDIKAVNTARLNAKAAGLTSDITVEERDFKDFTQPKDKSIMVTNPPYGERISTPDLLGTYKMIGERLKHQFTGNEAWILSYREECFAQIGLKPSIKIPVFNGSLECEFRKYQMFDGKMSVFREEGGVVKTDEEKRQMAEKRRFKQNREMPRPTSAHLSSVRWSVKRTRSVESPEKIEVLDILETTEIPKTSGILETLGTPATSKRHLRKTTDVSTMTKIKFLFILAFLVLPLATNAQENKQEDKKAEEIIDMLFDKMQKLFSLEDLNFGGRNYRNLQPENKWYAWWGDELVCIDKEQCFLVDKKTGKDIRPLTDDENNKRKDGAKATTITKDHQLYVVDAQGKEHQLTTDGSREIVYGQSAPQ